MDRDEWGWPTWHPWMALAAALALLILSGLGSLHGGGLSGENILGSSGVFAALAAAAVLFYAWTTQRRYAGVHRVARALRNGLEQGGIFAPLSDDGQSSDHVLRSYNRWLEQFRLREAANEASREFQINVLDAVAAEIAVVDRDGSIVAVNAPWMNFARDNAACPGENPAGTMIGANYFAVCAPRVLDPATASAKDIADSQQAMLAREGLLSVLEGRCSTFSMEYPCDTPTEKRWFAMFARPFGGATLCGAVISHIDITKIKESEEKARQAEVQASRLLQAIEQSPISILITDLKGRIEYVNPRFLEFTGYAREEVIGRTSAFLQSGTTPAGTYRRLWETIQNGRVWSGVLCNRKKSGEPVWEDLTIAPIIDAAGEIVKYVSIKNDVTAKLHIEKQLADHHAHLEDMVARRTAELSDALEAARIADRTKDEFLANITHELRTPLSAVLGFSGLARPFCTDPLQKEYLDKVSSAGKTLGKVIDDLLDLSKIVAGALKFDSAPFSMRALVARSSSVISYKAAEKGLQLREEIAADVPEVLIGDSLRVEQILLNLLGNAVKFTASGEVRLRIGLVAQEASQVQLEILVEDTGIGMDHASLSHLFKPFSQADTTITRRFGGTGLGLAICARLAEMMGGNIEARSVCGEGTQFRVRLWLEAGSSEMLEPEEEHMLDARLIRYQHARVLVVDDQELNRELVRGLLARVGIQACTACNGQEAIDSVVGSKQPFDLILMDVQMPVMDGLSATRELRKTWPPEAMPIVAMTAHTMTHERRRSFAIGMNDHIGKPFNLDTFYSVLARWLPIERQVSTPSTTQQVDRAAGQTSKSAMPTIPEVDTRAGLELMQGDVSRYQFWLREFAAEVEPTLQRINEALAADNLGSASMSVHVLKGRTGLLGMRNLHRQASQLENAIDAGKGYSDLLREFSHGVQRMSEEIQHTLGGARSADAQAGPGHNKNSGVPALGPSATHADRDENSAPHVLPPLPDSVRHLLARLELGDSDCQDLVACCVSELEGDPWAIPVLRAQGLCDRFDFPAAHAVLAEAAGEEAT